MVARSNFNLRQRTEASVLGSQIHVLKSTQPLIAQDFSRAAGDVRRQLNFQLQNIYSARAGLKEDRNFQLGELGRAKTETIAERDFELGNISREIGGLQRQRSEGLRDIDQTRVQQLQQVVSDALSRGIYRSGIREENEGIVERETSEASATLRANIQQALDSLGAQSNRVRSQANLALQGIAAQRSNVQSTFNREYTGLARQADEFRGATASALQGLHSQSQQQNIEFQGALTQLREQLALARGLKFDEGGGGGGGSININFPSDYQARIPDFTENITTPKFDRPPPLVRGGVG